MRLFQNSHFSFFFRNFFSFFKCLQRVSPSTFLIFCNKLDLKSLKGPPFTILKTLRLLSLRYSADFRRSRLVFHEIMEFSVLLLTYLLRDFSNSSLLNVPNTVLSVLIQFHRNCKTFVQFECYHEIMEFSVLLFTYLKVHWFGFLMSVRKELLTADLLKMFAQHIGVFRLK